MAQLDDIKGKLRDAAYTSRGVDLRRLFAFLDKDHGGHVDFEGFTRAIRRQKVPKERLGDETLWWLFQTIDDDNSGTIDVDEFIAFMGDDEPCSSNRGVNREGSLLKRVNALVPSIEEMQALKRKIRASSYTIGGVSLQKYFQFVDKDGNGLVDKEEFTCMMRRHKHTDVRLSDEKISVLFDCIDEDGSGEVELEELVSFIEEDRYDPNVAQRMVRDRIMSEVKSRKKTDSSKQQKQLPKGEASKKAWKSRVAGEIRAASSALKA